MCPRGAGSGVGLELSTHPLADLHLSGTAHLALNSKISWTARSAGGAGRGAQAPDAGAGLGRGFLGAAGQRCRAPAWSCAPPNPLLAGWSQLGALTSDCTNHRSCLIKSPSPPLTGLVKCGFTGSGESCWLWQVSSVTGADHAGKCHPV